MSIVEIACGAIKTVAVPFRTSRLAAGCSRKSTRVASVIGVRVPTRTLAAVASTPHASGTMVGVKGV